MSKKLIMATANKKKSEQQHTLIPLVSFVSGGVSAASSSTDAVSCQSSAAASSTAAAVNNGANNSANISNIGSSVGPNKNSIIRTTTIAYGIIELLLRSSDSNTSSSGVGLGDNSGGGGLNNDDIRVDNFAVYVEETSSSSDGDNRGDNKGDVKDDNNRERDNKKSTIIKGVSMLSSGKSVSIEEPSFFSLFDDDDDEEDNVDSTLNTTGGSGGNNNNSGGEILGRYLEVEEVDAASSFGRRAAAEMLLLLGSTNKSGGNNQVGAKGSSGVSSNTATVTTTTTTTICKAMARQVHETVLGDNSIQRCHYLVARVLYELFTREAFPDDDDDNENEEGGGPARKRTKFAQVITPPDYAQPFEGGGGDGGGGDNNTYFDIPAITRMKQLGIPYSLCRMVQSLLESAFTAADSSNSVVAPSGVSGLVRGKDAYESLGQVSEDLHLLLFDPDRFLFDPVETTTAATTSITAQQQQQQPQQQLFNYKKGELYGRDKEETLITDTFCRVTRGKSEAFFIGGFSGSGKSMLVNTLRVKVKAVGGYVIKHKFDAISDRPLSGIMSAVAKLCEMIKSTHSPTRLVKLVQRLRDEFGTDIGLLARMLPNISLLSSEFINSQDMEMEQGDDMMNAQSVCFTLLRFVRLISSPQHPVMLFLDDLQWADDTALDVIHTFVSDAMGSCIFFVGTYRDNEVGEGHAIFDLMEKLERSRVPTTKVSLTGLGEVDLNTMISDALGLYPRICKSLSDIVFQKTKGNPFFVLEFMESLRRRGLLRYDSRQKRWVWDEETIRAEEITDNVLHLLSSKMNGLSDDMRTLLKVMACFGTGTNKSVIGYLSESQEYRGVSNGLRKAIDDGLILEMDGKQNFKFAHDKVREAAYALIPDSGKQQFHYNLGKTLYSVCEGKDVGDTILIIASQINHGKESILKDDNLRILIVNLNVAAAKISIDSCRHKMAYSYLHTAQSLLPDDHFESHYDVSIQLYLMMASAANKICKYDEAELILKSISEKTRCTEHKLSAYYLLATMFTAQGKVVESYDTCCSALSQLGEEIPELIPLALVERMVPEVLHMYGQANEWVSKKMEDKNIILIAKFYTTIATAAYFCKPAHMVAYFICKTVLLSLQHGVCQYTPLALVQLSFIASRFDTASFTLLIAKNALELSENMNLNDQMADLTLNYYQGPGHLESFQSGAKKLREAFESGLTIGNANTAFYCAIQGTWFSLASGEKDLTSLLKQIDYYLHLLGTYKSEMTKYYLLCFRETISILIDKGEATSIDKKLTQEEVSNPDNKLLELFYFHQTFRNFWLGYTERCQHYVKLFLELQQPRYYDMYIFKFYQGLNMIDMLKKRRVYSRSEQVDQLIESMRTAASHAGANFKHKLELLEAEQFGVDNYPPKAMAAYDAAIASAKEAKFIHEQGLACEKAGFYYERMKDMQKSWQYFKQARECYEEWGSSFKVEFVQRELDRLQQQQNVQQQP